MRSPQAFSPIRLLRAARGVAQSDLAGAVGVSTSAISNLESGRRSASRDEFERVAKALDCPVEAVAGGDFTVTARAGEVEVVAGG